MILDKKEHERSSSKYGFSTQVYVKENKKKSKENPRAYFDILQKDQHLGRIVMELFANVTPKTVDNFLKLCEGSVSDEKWGNLSYKNSIFHRIIKGFMLQV